MTSGVAAAASSASFSPDGLLADLLAISLTGVNVLRPLYGTSGELDDFALEYFNPAAQRMTGLSERPGGTTRARFPAVFANGVFAFYKRVYETGEAGRYDVNYQADGLDNYFHVAACRSGDLLVVSFTDTSDQDRSAVEQALRESQAAEQQARREAEHQRNELQHYIEQAPVAVVLYRGPEHRVAVANAAALAIWDRTWVQVRHRPVFEVLPEAAQPHVVAFFHQVFTTGEPYVAHELPTIIHRHGRQETVYWNFVFQPERQPDGHITGILTVGTDVTEQVLARQQLERLNEELELRVTARSAETRAALFEAEQQREQLRQQQALLGQILRQVPAAIATFDGPEHRHTFFNEPYQALAAGRTHLGQSVAEVFPEAKEQSFLALLDQVYRTGQPLVGTDTPVMLLDAATGQAEQRYVDFVYQPLFEGQPHPQGILAFSVDVTEKARARQQAETLQAAMLATVQRQREERENVYQLFGQAPAAICLLREPDHRIEYLNPAYQALHPGQALQGRTLAEVQPENAALVTLFDGIYKGGQTQFEAEVPIRIPQPSGQPPLTRYFDFTYQAYRENGRIAGVSVFGFDVTERVLSRQQVEATAQRLRLLTDALPVLIGYLDRARRYQFANRAYEAWFDQPADALLGRYVQEVVGEAAYQAAAGYMDRALAGERVAFTASMPYRDGFVKHIHTDYIPDVQQGEVVGFYSLMADITEQVTIREQLEAQRAELQRIFELAPVAISVYRGDDYRVEFVNPPLAAIIGRVPAQMLGRRLEEFLPEMRREGLQAVLDEVRRTGEPFVAQELPVTVVRNGQQELGYFNFVYQPLPDAQGQRTGVVCVATEVTEQVRARQQAQAANAELHHVNARLTRINTDLDTFVYTASHDLKAPITNIEGLLEALRADLPPVILQDALIAQLLDLMQDSVARFQQTIGHLSDISRLQQPEETASINLVELAASVRLDLAPLLEAAAAQLTVDADECTAVHVAPKTLRSVVYNLLSNAIKYRAPDRPARVQLRAHCVPGHLVLAVQDNGLGLTETQQTEIFGMFRRLHTHVEGSGVGLFMVKRLVENAGGTITVQSQLAVGTTFTVSLPA